MTFFNVKEWSNFQHYKDRAPPWIKLHKTLLDDYEFQCLPVASRALAPMLWLLASESINGLVDCDSKKLAFRLRCSEKEIIEGIKPLINKGFLVVASVMLAECKQGAMLETETETETEENNVANKVGNCPYSEIVKIYNDTLKTLPMVKEITAKRKTEISARWKENEKRQTIEWWQRFFDHISKSDFLTGRNGSWNACCFDWIIKSANFIKIIEGNYDNKAST